MSSAKLRPMDSQNMGKEKISKLYCATPQPVKGDSFDEHFF